MTLPSGEIEALEARMRPGRMSRAGFLGPSEGLRAVLAADSQAMRQAGLTFEGPAMALGEMLAVATASATGEAIVNERHRVRIQQYQGFQLCPWSPDPRHALCSMGTAPGLLYSSLDWRLWNLRTGQVLGGPGLIVHLMYVHHFCEGRQSPYRVDPVALSRLLELA